jgi:hypothetical protein
MGVGVGVSRAGTISASAGSMAFALLAAAIAHAQTPPAMPPTPPPVATAVPQPRPVTGFVSSYAILRTARAAGFEPLAPPLRDGTIYVLRATDFRGILMRVVLDARTGAIRDATRIVPADADAYEMSTPYGAPPYASPPYAPPPYEPPPYEPYGAPAAYDGPGPQMAPPGEGAPPVLTRPPAALTTTRPAAAVHSSSPPLPHPRPAELVTQQSEKIGTPKAPSGLAQSANVQPRGGANAGAAAAPTVAPSKTPVPAPLND